MFDKNFYPTPEETLDEMIQGEAIEGRVCYEPQAGKGDIVDRLYFEGAREVIASELHPELRKIAGTKCKLIGDDFFKVESHQISHVDLIIMNPPFDNADKHFLHAYNIAPQGCRIISLMNYSSIKNSYSESRKLMCQIIDEHGHYKNLGDCFSEAERSTGVEVALVKITKPGANYSTEFEGFFLEEDEEEQSASGIMSYNVVRDLVNRYVAAVKLFDEQLEIGVKMENLTSNFFSSELAFGCTQQHKPVKRNEFKKDLQKSGWKFIFDKLNMAKYATRGLREDINKFVETQINVPFTMRNIYKMLEVIVGTNGSRMDKAMLEVFDRLTESYHDNRYNIEGWKTNSHYLINEKFIMNGLVTVGWSGEVARSTYSRFETIEDFLKALCYLTGDNYDHFISLENAIRYPYKLKIVSSYDKNVRNTYNGFDTIEKAESAKAQLQEEGTQSEIIEQRFSWGQWYEWAYFDIKCFKKGTIHFKFKSRDLWAKFNGKVAQLKGYPLPEFVKKATTQANPTKAKPEASNYTPKVLATITLKQ